MKQNNPMEPIFEMEMKVRDYECDLQGIVNNANYQHYYEHTRHEFLTQHGISFARLHDEGIDFVVARLEMAFRSPLRSGDTFVSELALEQEGIKYVFQHDLYRLSDNKLSFRATVDLVCLVNGKLAASSGYDKMLEYNGNTIDIQEEGK